MIYITGTTRKDEIAMSQPPPEEFLSDDTMAQWIHALGHSHRRAILLGLEAGQIDTAASAVMRGGQAEEIKRELKDEHLPLLEEAGFIEWDPETGDVRKGPDFDEIRPLLELIRNHPEELPPGWP